MAKKLIITEKPSVARDFARVLNVSGKGNGAIENNEYVISWCVGHLVEMLYPEAYDLKYKKWNVSDLPFLPKEYKYGVIENVKAQYEIVNHLLHRTDIDTVYWAGDSGKEGQTIEENIRNYGGVREGMKELRVWIDSQTDDEIKRGIKEARPMTDYASLGRSGIMRSIEDYALGINFSRALSVKYGKLLNDAAGTKSYTAIAVGRVMTCVLGMVVNREREIRDFCETCFYKVSGRFSEYLLDAEWKVNEQSLFFQSPALYKDNGFVKEEDAQKLISQCSGKKAIIQTVEKVVSKKKAPLLFNLAELQAECSKMFKISPDETLSVAQELYERKLTTYPRTDARVLTQAVAKEISKTLYKLKDFEPTKGFVQTIIKENLYRNLEKTMYTDDSKVTDHYAIIPTGQVNEIKGLSQLQKQVYMLILRRFLSIFYPPAEYLNLKLVIDVDHELFGMSSKILQKKGYMEIVGVNKTNENEEAETEDNKQNLNHLIETMKQGDEISAAEFSIKEGKTSPPKRYTSGTMILAMENAGNLIEDEELRAQIKNTGIGTSATRAEIIKKLVKIGYLNLNTKTQVLSPENLGEMIFEVVDMSVPSLLNPKMTASWERGLEGIVNGSVFLDDYRDKLEEYIRTETINMIQSDLTIPIAGKINRFTGKNAKGIAARKKLGIACPLCGGELSTTSFGYGCSNYWDEGKKCKFQVGTIAGVSISEEEFTNLIQNGTTNVIEGFTASNKKKFNARLVLKKNEEGIPEIKFDFTNIEPIALKDVVCPDCGGKLLIKSFGYGCENYRPQDESSCHFAIGKIAKKELTQAQVKELLTEGKTSTIRGFKSKNGTKFDACLILKKDENQKSQISFDFDSVEAKIIKDVVCPICGSEIMKTSFGYGCSNYRKEDPNSCRFSIGKISSKELNESQIKELLTKGITSTIYGFKSKNGTKFDGRVALQKDEQGKVTGICLSFDDLEPQKLKDCKCPICSSEIAITKFGYRCINHQKEKEDSCPFFVGRIAGVDLSAAQVTELLKNKKTDIIKGFVAKTGMMFEAALKLDDSGKVVFDFGPESETAETKMVCPICQKNIVKKAWYYTCDCGKRIPHTMSQLPLSDEAVLELLTAGKTAQKISGFISKSGKPFEAKLVMTDGKVSFDFSNEDNAEVKDNSVIENSNEKITEGI